MHLDGIRLLWLHGNNKARPSSVWPFQSAPLPSHFSKVKKVMKSSCILAISAILSRMPMGRAFTWWSEKKQFEFYLAKHKNFNENLFYEPGLHENFACFERVLRDCKIAANS